jgi:hypothetical protein
MIEHVAMKAEGKPRKMTPFHGATYEARLDHDRLDSALHRVARYMRSHGDWRSLKDVAVSCGCSEAGASARLRDMRKAYHALVLGVKAVESRRVSATGLWLYRVTFK